MRNKKTLTIIFPIFIVIFALTLISIDLINQSKNVTNPTTAKDESDSIPVQSPNTDSSAVMSQSITPAKSISASGQWGNTPGNITNGGNFAKRGNYLYFSYVDSKTRKGFNLSRSRLDASTGLSELCKLQASSINVLEDYIYFLNIYGHICRTDLDGKNLTVLKTGRFYNLLAYDNYLYFMEKSNIYRLPMQDPNDITQIASEVIAFTISSDGKSLFYLKKNLNILDRPIYRVSLESLQTELLVESPVYSTFLALYTHGKHLYVKRIDYNISDTPHSSVVNITRIDTESAEITEDKYFSTHIGDFTQCNIEGEDLYVVNYINNQLEIHKKSLVDGSISELNLPAGDFEPINFYVFDNHIYILMHDYINSEIWTYNYTDKSLRKNTFTDGYFLIN